MEIRYGYVDYTVTTAGKQFEKIFRRGKSTVGMDMVVGMDMTSIVKRRNERAFFKDFIKSKSFFLFLIFFAFDKHFLYF